ncbi:TlyA family RNA methyltransferase [Mesomycoplasma ovipneumoniae]|uniref:TlyA family RNA methyltransferase n=1 Tax=Mesomycoplasma ovipneumoniae TaxID=29562 RepID=UPI0028ACFABC|nr:TlyA family RNA methyltransferase [Mesomycoplasma ovipneumoniae]WNM14304.1 TlyA family RNA methyltransferase [Mesomycoplasma ovipneumoniae]
MNLLSKILSMGFEKAESLIKTGHVKVNNKICLLPAYKIKNLDQVTVEIKEKYVSRGAIKLLWAYEKFGLDFNDKIVLDIGSSKGGFTQICLQKGAKKVYALDSGLNQLDYSLRIDPRVSVKEKTNIKYVTSDFFDEKIDIIVCDVSFISLKIILNVVKNLLKKGQSFIALFKPQFEASSKYVQKGGYVLPEFHEFLINRLVEFAKNDFDLVNSTKSPIKGLKSKNIEYFLHFIKKND